MFLRRLQLFARINRGGARFSTRTKRDSRQSLFEALETRCVLSCTATINQGTLLIMGDVTGNDVHLQDEGPAGISATCDGKPLVDGTLVNRIAINTLGGPDTIDYRTDGAVSSGGPRTLDVNTGSGNDELSVMYNALIGLLINADLGKGDDLFVLKVPESPDSSGDVALVPAVRADVDGGAGSDVFRVDVGDVTADPANPRHVKAFLDLNLNGGGDADAFLIGLLNVAIDGDVTIAADGGQGADQFSTNWQNVELIPGPHVTLDGGGGADAFLIGLLNVAAPAQSGAAAGDEAAEAALDIDVATGRGNDRVDVTLQDVNVESHLDVDLGANDDQFTATLLPDSNADQLNLFQCDAIGVHGGSGKDTFVLDVGDKGLPAPGAAQPHLSAELMMDFDGGDGADAYLIGLLNVAIDGAVTMDLNGGDGADQFTQNIQNVAFGSDAQIGVDSGSGADRILIGLLNVATPVGGDKLASPLSLKLFTGGGDDSVSISSDELEMELHALVDLGTGNDSFLAFLQCDDAPAAFQVLGRDGNDTVRATFSETYADLSMDVDLGRGNDTANIGFTGPANMEMMAGANVNALPPSTDIHVDGAGGADRLSLNFSGQLIGPAAVVLDGGDENDAIDATFNLASTNDYSLLAHVVGGKGDDNLAFHVKVFDSESRDDLDLLLDASQGRDKFSASDNVKIKKA